ncbi:MAG: helix-turn-helix transcriptional regulator [Thermosynechococcaceae cyanobacterium MS004]|nr:helix-turn-helix transcriptional regulator [Thermosynechococcaceae cyanobacterium MS004]
MIPVPANDAPDYVQILRQSMTAVGLPSLRSLSENSGVSRRQVRRLQTGEAHLLSVQHAQQLARSLQISLPELIQTFSSTTLALTPESGPAETTPAETNIVAEYQRLKNEMAQLRSQLFQVFQLETLNTLETLLLYWPTAAHKAKQDPTAPAVQLLPLLRPLENLLQSWAIETIGAVGETVCYNPQLHQWNAPHSPPERDAPVRITHVGYRQSHRILHRAKVAAVAG